MAHRLIHWPSMSRPLKFITGLAIAQILAAAVLIVLGGVPSIGGRLPSVSLYVLDNQLVSTSLPVLIATLVFLAIAWGYLLAGVAHAHPVIQVAGLTLFTVVTFTGWDSLRIDGGTLWVSVVIVAAIWAVGAITWLMHRRAHRLDPDGAGSQVATALTFFASALLVGGLYLNAYLTARDKGAPLLFTFALSIQLASLGLLLIPLLIIAGADFADLAELVGNRVGAFGRHRAGPRFVFVLAAAVALAVFGYQVFYFRHSLGVIGADVAVGVVALAIGGLLLWLARVTIRPKLPNVPHGAVVLVAVISFGVLFILIFVPARDAAVAAARNKPAVSYGSYAYPLVPQFHLDKPSAWQTTENTAPDGTVTVSLDGTAQGDPAILTVLAVPQSSVTAFTGVDGELLALTSSTGLWKGQTAYLDAGHDVGATRVYDVHTVPIFEGQPYRARTWSETQRGYTWLLVAITPAKDWDFNQPVFDKMASSFAVGPPVPPAETTTPNNAAASLLAGVERPETVSLGALLLLALCTLVMTRFQIGRRFAPRVTTAAIFTTLAAVLSIAAVPNYVLDVVTNTPGHTLTPFHVEGIQTLVGLLSLGWIAWCLLSRGIDELARPIALVLSLNIGLQILSWLYDLYTQTSGVSNFSVAQAVILVLAFLVDILLSGEGTTNRDGRLFPRSARVHLYFGYVLMTVAAILYFTTLRYQATGGAVPSQFESDRWPQLGLIELGVPLLLTFFLINLMRWRASRPNEAKVDGDS
jgi:hypothetical protein